MSVLAYAGGRRAAGRRAVAVDALFVLAGSLVIAVLAQVTIPLPGNPVPVTGQTLGVLLIGAALGSTRGALSVGAYVAEGALGVPVFAGGANLAGLLARPATLGYLLGFVLGAFVVGLLAERRWDRRPLTALPAMLAGEVVIFLCGVAWLTPLVNGSLTAAVQLGVLPFLAGEAVKVAVAATLLPGAWSLLGRTES